MSCEKSYFPPKRARSSLECKDKDTSCTAFFWFVSLLRLNLQNSTFIFKILHLSTFHGLKSLQKSTFIYIYLQESTRVHKNLHFSTKIFKNLHLSSNYGARNLQESSILFNSLQNSSIFLSAIIGKMGEKYIARARKKLVYPLKIYLSF